MKLSTLNELPEKREMIDAFRGYNHNLRISEGEFYEMKNLTSDNYPSLSPRKKRGIYKELDNPLGIIAKDDLWYVDGTKIYKNGEEIEGFSLKEIKDENDKLIPKTLISMGAYIIIMPDKKYINTKKPSDSGDIDQAKELSITFEDFEEGKTYKAYMCDENGDIYTNPTFTNPDKTTYVPDIFRGATSPEEYYPGETLPNGVLWRDTSSSPTILKIYDRQRSMWNAVNVYSKIKVTDKDNPDGFFKGFSEGDGVSIKGLGFYTDDYIVIEKKISDDEIIVKYDILSNHDSDYIFASQDAKFEQVEFTIKRTMPEVDFIIESENRLWGCKYGIVKVDGKDQMVNKICASKLGDFKNWNCFAGISTDSYVASVGTDGQFTGAITYLGHPMFFKENCVHKVYGSYPSNYQIQTTTCRGVQQGSEKSLAIVNETLIYKSRNAICAYEGAQPVEISSPLGSIQYSNAISGAIGNKYYVSMKAVGEKDPAKEYSLFVYDISKGMWHKEDNTQALSFCNFEGNLYYIDYDDNKIKSIVATSDAEEVNREDKDVEWSAESGIIGTDSPDKKYISRLTVRAKLEFGSRVTMFAEYDSSGCWEYVGTIDGTSLATHSIPMRLKRCDHFRIKILGKGNAQIFSICKSISEGSSY